MTAMSPARRDRKSTRLNSSHLVISYAVFCLKKKRNLRAGAEDTGIGPSPGRGRDRQPDGSLPFAVPGDSGRCDGLALLFFLIIRPPPTSPLFPYRTPFG